MPPKKSPASARAKASAKPPQFKSPITPVLPAQPLQVMAPTATMTETNIALGTLIICCLAVMAAFSAQMMAGIIGTANASKIVTCIDSDRGQNIYLAGTTSLSNGKKSSDSCSGNVLYEKYCVNGTVGWTVGSKIYTCANGCNNGACAKLPCLISDVQKLLNPALTNQALPPNALRQKISSFVVQAPAGYGITITKISVSLAGGSLPVAQLANLAIGDNPTPQAPAVSGANNFLVNINVAAGQSRVIDVYTDIGNVSGADLGKTINPIIGATISNPCGTNVSSFSGLVGQVMTVNGGYLSAVTFATSSALTSRYVLGGTAVDNTAVYRVVAANAPIIIDEMSFHVIGPSGVDPVTSLTIHPFGSMSNSWIAYINNNYATTTNMNLSVPVGYAGQNISVKALFSNVGPNQPLAHGNVNTKIAINYIKYRSGTTVVTVYFRDSSLPSPSYYVVGSIPSVFLGQPGSRLTSGIIKLANINLNAENTVSIKRIGFTINTSAKVNVKDLIIRDYAGTILTPVTQLSGANANMVFNNGYGVSQSQTQNLTLYGVVEAVSPWGNAGTEYVSTGLADASNFIWDDITGDTTNLNGNSIYGYATDAIAIIN